MQRSPDAFLAGLCSCSRADAKCSMREQPGRLLGSVPRTLDLRPHSSPAAELTQGQSLRRRPPLPRACRPRFSCAWLRLSVQRLPVSRCKAHARTHIVRVAPRSSRWPGAMDAGVMSCRCRVIPARCHAGAMACWRSGTLVRCRAPLDCGSTERGPRARIRLKLTAMLVSRFLQGRSNSCLRQSRARQARIWITTSRRA